MTTRIAVLLVCAIAGSAVARPPRGSGGALADLAEPRRGEARRESSWDRTGGNVDFRPLGPGEELTLLDYQGAAIVRHFWTTFVALGPVAASPRLLVLRMYWDGEPTPSVEAPLGDFFGVGFGELRDYVSLPSSRTSGGYNCYWPMPFHRSARWTLTNVGPVAVLVWWNIDFTAFGKLPRELRHFHAQWRRENPTTLGVPYTILEARGEGHYVGAAVFMQNRAHPPPGPLGPLGFLEGDEAIFVDGAAEPTVRGTGTEEYFGGGFYFETGPYAAPFHGAPLRDLALGRVSAYRWQIEDAVPFRRSIRVTLEHGGLNEYETDHASVAFFYQREPHAPFPRFASDPAALLPYEPPGP